MTYCEYADGANNRLGAARVQRVPSLRDAISAMREPQGLGIGGSLDCGATSHTPRRSRDLGSRPSDGVSDNFYDVWVTLTHPESIRALLASDRLGLGVRRRTDLRPASTRALATANRCLA